MKIEATANIARIVIITIIISLFAILTTCQAGTLDSIDWAGMASIENHGSVYEIETNDPADFGRMHRILEAQYNNSSVQNISPYSMTRVYTTRDTCVVLHMEMSDEIELTITYTER